MEKVVSRLSFGTKGFTRRKAWVSVMMRSGGELSLFRVEANSSG